MALASWMTKLKIASFRNQAALFFFSSKIDRTSILSLQEHASWPRDASIILLPQSSLSILTSYPMQPPRPHSPSTTLESSITESTRMSLLHIQLALISKVQLCQLRWLMIRIPFSNRITIKNSIITINLTHQDDTLKMKQFIE